MKKLLGSIAFIAVTVMLVVSAVFAATTLTHTTTANITYQLTNAYVKITASASQYATGEKEPDDYFSYEGDKNAPKAATTESWDMKNITINENGMTIYIKIENSGANRVNVKVGTPTVPNNLGLTCVDDQSTAVAMANDTSATVITLDGKTEAATASVTLTFTLAVADDFTKVASGSLAIPVIIEGIPS